MPGKSGMAARHSTPRFALVIPSGAHRQDNGRPAVPDWSTQVDPKQLSSLGVLNASCPFRSLAAPPERLRRPQAHSLRHAIAEPRPLAYGCAGRRVPPGPIRPGYGALKRQKVPLVAPLRKMSRLSGPPKAKLVVAISPFGLGTKPRMMPRGAIWRRPPSRKAEARQLPLTA